MANEPTSASKPLGEESSDAGQAGPGSAGEPKPFTIRGDRLLLYLDVIYALRSYAVNTRGWPHQEWQNPRGLSYARIWRVLHGRMGLDGIAAMAYSMHDHTKTARDPLDRFLRLNIAQLASLEFVPPLIRTTNEQRDEPKRASATRPRRERDGGVEKPRAEQLAELTEKAHRNMYVEVRRVNHDLLHAIASGELTEENFKE